MSWIDDWNDGIWNALSIHFPKLMGEAVNGVVKGVSMATDAIGEVLGIILTLIDRMKIEKETELQAARLRELQGSDMYPIDAQVLAKLVHFGEGHQQYVEQMRRLQGRFPSTLAAYYELTRTNLDPSMLLTLWRRGIIDEPYVDRVLRENGYVDDVANFVKSPEGYDFTWGFDKRNDRQYLKRLQSVLPALPDIVRMDVRDSFPKSPAQHPDWIKTDERWKEWAAREGVKIAPLDWPTEGQDITDALRMGQPPYGPQSFASWFLGGRQEYTEAFEKAAQAQGLEPYWAMKFWESHWVLPGFELSRVLLHRTPEVTEELFKSIMRWQDFPPALIDAMMKVAYRPLTRVDVRRMHLRGVLSITEVFKAYLDFGYDVRNAARMTSFTAVWNMERIYGGTIKEILKAFQDGVYTRGQAGDRIWSIVGTEADDGIPSDAGDYLTDQQIEAVRETYEQIKNEKMAYILQNLDIVDAEKNIEAHTEAVETARKMFTSWQWTGENTAGYLASLGFSSTRVVSLLRRWQPQRDRKEKMPSRAMLEDFLLEQNMPVETWSRYMSRLGYSPTMIQQILEGVGVLPTQSMLERFLAQEVITEDVFKKYMKRLGFDSWVIDSLLRAIEEED